MVSSITWLVILAAFSGLSLNLILQFGLALKGVVFDESTGKDKLLADSAVLFVTIVLLWLLFVGIRSVLFLGFLEYLMLFPVSVMVFSGLEYLANRFILKKNTGREGPLPGNSIFSGGTLAGAALFITLNVASNVGEAIALSLGFSCTVALVFVVADEIRRRSGMEAVPVSLRGGPLALIAMGLLSLIASSAVLMLFGVLGTQ